MSERKTRTLAIVALVIIVIAAIFGGWYYYSQSIKPAPPKTLVVGTVRTFEFSWDPAVSWGSLEMWVHRHIFDTLVEYRETGEGLELVPGLATSWEASPDGMEYTFKLREGVNFIDGTPVDANAVKFSIESCNELGDLQSYYTSMVDHVEVIDDYTVKIVLKYAYSPFVASTSWTAFSIISPTAVEQHGREWLHDNAVGSGRFKLVEYVPKEKTVLEANKEHWDPPKSDRVIIRTFPDETGLRLALERGEVDLIFALLPPEDLVALKENPEFNVYRGGAPALLYWDFTGKATPYNNSAVKKAICSAMDKEEIARVIFKGTMTPSYSYMPTTVWTYTPVFKELYPYDVEKARQYLKEAGYSEGVTLTLYIDSTQKYWRFCGEMLKEQLAKAGITLNLEIIESATLWDMVYKGELLHSWFNWWGPVYPDPHEILEGTLHSEFTPWTGSFYKNPELDKVIEEDRVTLDKQKREQLLMQIQRMAAQDVPYIPLFDWVDVIVAHKYVKGGIDIYLRHPRFLDLLWVEKGSQAIVASWIVTNIETLSERLKSVQVD